MKRLLIGLASAACFAASATAADLVTKAPPAFSWMGCYVGVNGGYGFSRKRDLAVIETFNSGGINFSDGGYGVFGALGPHDFFVGGQGGCNVLQRGAWILGIEADIQAADIADTTYGTVVNFLPGLTAEVGATERLRMFGTSRLRLGYAWDRTLLYATGGLAFGLMEFNFRFSDNFQFVGSTARRDWRGGFALGGGIEHAFTGGFSLKAEYQYINLLTENYQAQLLFGPAFVPTAFYENINRRHDFHTVRLGVNWKLSGPALMR